MAKIEPVDFGKITNELPNAFNQISCFLSCIGDTVEVLQRESERHELHFGSNGVFLGMTSLANPVVSYTAEHWLATFVQGECEDLPDNVNGLWKEYASADEALRGLPEEIAQLLNQHNGNKPWRSMVRQECLDILLVWPGEAIHNLAAKKVSSHVPILLKNAKHSDPHEKWAYFRERLEFYRSQILAIRDEFDSEARANGNNSDASNRKTVAEANSKAMELAEENPEFVKSNQREWAEKIGCSVGLVAKTTLWQETMNRSGRGKKGQGRKPKKVSLTKAVEETEGDGKPDDALNKLIAEQESDYEPSPLVSKGRNPISRD